MQALPTRPSRVGAYLLLIVVLPLLVGCDLTQTYDVVGRVVGFGDDGRTLIVEHEDVPGLMPAMTMPFKALRSEEVAALDVGDAVGFVLHVSPDSTWISGIEELPDDAVARSPAGSALPVPDAAPAVLTEGDRLAPFTLVAADGDTLSRADLEGHVWLVDFIYTRCPLPDFCTLLSRRFQQIQSHLAARGADGVRLLSVSVDPEYDTPAVLRAYAERYGADPDVWTFATGSPEEVSRVAEMFGVFYREQGDEIVHNLTTALVDADGRIRGIWRGNDWQVDEVLDAVTRLAPPVARTPDASAR